MSLYLTPTPGPPQPQKSNFLSVTLATIIGWEKFTSEHIEEMENLRLSMRAQIKIDRERLARQFPGMEVESLPLLGYIAAGGPEYVEGEQLKVAEEDIKFGHGKKP